VVQSGFEGVPQDQISTRLVYTNPTVSGLTAALKEMSVSNGATNSTNWHASREQKMEETLDRYIKQLPAPSSRPKEARSDEDEHLTVGLTGSTG
jgi:hypothetical protein